MDSATFDQELHACKEKYGERCKIIKHQGDYAWIVRLKFSDQISAQFALPKDTPDFMEVYLIGKNISKNLQETFNQAISAAGRSPSDLGSCTDKTENWWVGTESEVLSQSAESQLPAGYSYEPKKSGQKIKKSQNSGLVSDFHTHTVSATGTNMKPAQDVISRILWDQNLPQDNFSVGYLDRFLGVVEKPFPAFNWDNFSQVDPEETAIPRHRIQYFKYGDRIVWDRRNRLDLIFGSGNRETPESWETIEEIIKQENQRLGLLAVPDENTGYSDLENHEDSDFEGFEDVPHGTRPNYYLNIPITNPELLDQIRGVQDSFISHFPRAIKKCLRDHP